MPVARDIAATYRGPRRVMRRLLAQGRREDRAIAYLMISCFLIFVAVAGVFGAATVTTRTLIIQTLPAVIALVLLHLGRRNAAGD